MLRIASRCTIEVADQPTRMCWGASRDATIASASNIPVNTTGVETPKRGLGWVGIRNSPQYPGPKW